MTKRGSLLAWGLPQYSTETVPLFVTQEDIREVQIAKAAIAAGLELLLKKARMWTSDLEEIILTGGSGVNVDVEDVQGLGVIPMGVKVRFQRENAGKGAVRIAADPALMETVQQLADKIRYVNVNMESEFDDLCLKHLSFQKYS